MKKQKSDSIKPNLHQTYKFDKTVFKVESVFKKDGKRTLLQSLGKMVAKGLKES